MAVTKRGPGPDWNIQEGQYQPIGDPAESARRSVFGAVPSTGHLIWGSSFNENIAEIEETIGPPGSGSVDWTEIRANSGAGAIKVQTGNAIGNSAGVKRYSNPISLSKTGLSVVSYSEIDLAGLSVTDLILRIRINYYGGANKYISGSIKISRDALGVTRLYYEDSLGNWSDSGQNIGGFFVNTADMFNFSYWRNIKFVIDPTGATLKYVYFEIDGSRFDLSSYTGVTSPLAYDRPLSMVWLLLETQEAISKTINLDDIGFTDSEP